MEELVNYKWLDFVKTATKQPKSVVAYTDGAYSSDWHYYGSGMVFVHESHITTQYFKGNDPKYVSSGSASGRIVCSLICHGVCH